MTYYRRKVRRIAYRSQREKDRRMSIAMCVTFLLTGLALMPFGYFLMANMDAISTVTKDDPSLIGTLGVISIFGGFCALLLVPIVASEV